MGSTNRSDLRILLGSAVLFITSLNLLWYSQSVSSYPLQPLNVPSLDQPHTDGKSSTNGCPDTLRGPGLPTFKNREDLGKIMEAEGFTIGAELGVKQGNYARVILTDWFSCNEYHLVDLWAHQENYKDIANVAQDTQNEFYDETLEKLDPWKDKIRVCRNYTTSCAKLVEDDYFDFIYVDARHDFKGVFDDLVDWWPKLKVGGIIAGHDYVTQDDGPKQTRQDWTTNYDGTKDRTRTVVKGAVDAFAASVCRQVTVAYRERSWNTWAFRK